jgi:hypothetical protein
MSKLKKRLRSENACGFDFSKCRNETAVGIKKQVTRKKKRL